MTDAPVQVDRVWKRYGLPLAPALRSVASRLRGSSAPTVANDSARRDVWALRDVSLEVKQGETLGMIGRNGAGKSTLLKLLAGVTPPTHGRINMRGSIFPMIELQAGIHPELTGRENVYLLAAVMGIPRRVIADSLPAIEDFCELGEWFDRPVRKYSSGMQARLGFSVAMHVEADILLIDEVLSVGDFAFQKKCMDRITNTSREGRTVLFVSHNPYMVERICDRVVWLQDGRLQELGSPSEVLHRYFEVVSQSAQASPDGPRALPPEARPGSGDLRVTQVELLGPDGSPTTTVRTGDPVTFRVHYKIHRPVEGPNFGIRIFDPQNTMVASLASTAVRSRQMVDCDGYFDCHVATLALMPSVYTIQVKIAGDTTLDMVENATRFTVNATTDVLIETANMGVAYLPATWDWSIRSSK